MATDSPTREASSPAHQNEKWTTCCSRTEASFIRYIAQLCVALIVLVFAITMVAMGQTDPYYYGIITLVIGLFLPEPKHKPPFRTNNSF